jgi:nitrite reductase/ring-hydroxylating ferredoxin subunit
VEKIANLKDIAPGQAVDFEHRGKKAILVHTRDEEPVAYFAVCPHEGGGIEWDEQLQKFLCECHMSIFNVDGSLYRHSSLFELDEGLTRIDLKVDDRQNVQAL